MVIGVKEDSLPFSCYNDRVHGTSISLVIFFIPSCQKAPQPVGRSTPPQVRKVYPPAAVLSYPRLALEEINDRPEDMVFRLLALGQVIIRDKARVLFLHRILHWTILPAITSFCFIQRLWLSSGVRLCMRWASTPFMAESRCQSGASSHAGWESSSIA